MIAEETGPRPIPTPIPDPERPPMPDPAPDPGPDEIPFPAVIGLDEAITLVGIEEFHGSGNHMGILLSHG